MNAEIRPFEPGSDLEGLRTCVVELQEYERTLDSRMPPGEEIVDEYISDMASQCEANNGLILVALSHDEVIGYVMVLCKVTSGDLDDGNIEFGLISDLMVREAFRGHHLGEQLVRAAESVAKARGVTWLRINVLASNKSARALYQRLGYADYTLDLEKTLA